MRLSLFLVTLALVGSVLVACGDDDDDEALSKSEYIAEADRICARANADFEQLFETDFPTTQAALSDFFEKAGPIRRRQMEDLKALEAPEADKARVDRLLAAGDRVVADFEKATTDERFGAKVFNEEGGANAAAFDKQARAYGFKRCGEEEEDEDEEETRVDTSGFSAEKKAFIKKVDAVCAAGNKRFSALEQRYLTTFPPPLETWSRFLPEVAKEGRRQADQIKAITPPEAEEAKFDEFNRRQDSLISQFERAGELAAAKDEAGFQRASRKIFSESEDFDADLRAYGFQECGEEEEAE